MTEKLPTRNGMNVCSRRDPVKEARAWVSSLGLRLAERIHKTDRFVVLGGGAGFHLLELSLVRPDAQILVFDPSQEMRDHFQPSSSIHWCLSVEELQSRLVHQPYRLLTFKPAWQGAQADFALAFQTLKRAQLHGRAELLAPDDRLLWNLMLSCVRFKEGEPQCA